MAKHLPRWALVGGIVAGGAAVAAIAVRRLFARGYDERPLGEPVAYPAAGSGTGFPEPTSPEHTEQIDEGVVPELHGPVAPREDGPAGSAAGEPFFREPNSAPVESGTPHIGAGGANAGEPTAAAAPDIEDLTPTLKMPPTLPASPAHEKLPPAPTPDVISAPAGGDAPQEALPPPEIAITDTPQPLSDDPSGGTTAVRSEPLQRAPTALSEEQAEMNARLQVRQPALYAAFPGLTPRDLVDSEGDLDRLAQTAASRSGGSPEDARARLNTILGTGSEQKSDEGIEPNLSESQQ